MVFTCPKPVFFASGVFENSEYVQLSGIFIEKYRFATLSFPPAKTGVTEKDSRNISLLIL